MAIENITKDKQGNFIIPKGMSLNRLFNELDVIGAIERNIEYRKSHGLPLIYDVYTRKEDGSWEIKKDIEINN